jgi:hypothetical protein
MKLRRTVIVARLFFQSFGQVVLFVAMLQFLLALAANQQQLALPGSGIRSYLFWTDDLLRHEALDA